MFYLFKLAIAPNEVGIYYKQRVTSPDLVFWPGFLGNGKCGRVKLRSQVYKGKCCLGSRMFCQLNAIPDIFQINTRLFDLATPKLTAIRT
ncbi:MAG TPA: hypothetical protein DCG19_04180 [Cryomorphaceae bacterium]|nr:hypothetical protein [Owenweeksia sp.]MBF99612.1 hypothetical protein [Owenweeksia sp.]HAD96579.1 hypothetical protein [Cryomorphaceae bacterium]HBF21677.1 hypothetical protein [Cryomorphaceae bacterium]HCQ15789.1 hypothetical protein [Cryomorphaceae bacterium]